MIKILKVLSFIALGIYSVYGASHPQVFWLFDGVNVLFHEAGHVFLMFFGRYLHAAGGTIFQLLIPFAIGVSFLYKKQPCSAAVMFWWFGENFVPIARYIQDARDQSMPFVGGEEHDWGYLLNVHRAIQYDRQIGEAVLFAGVLVMLTAVFYGIFAALYSGKSRSADSSGT